jgi:hypothetical protein
MVDVKREDLTLQDWTKGISADEFAWGSYFYSEWIQTWYNTKWFKLWPRLDNQIINYRSDGYAVALSPAGWYWITVFTHDRRLETYDTYNWSLDWEWDSQWGGALYAQQANTTTRWVNWITYWTNAIWIRASYIDVIDRDGLFNPNLELLTNTWFDSDWTIGTGWTVTDKWAEHTTGNTGTLTADCTVASGKIRVAVKVSHYKDWTLTVDAGWVTDTLSSKWWFVATFTVSAWTATITLTPSSDFDWTIEMVNVHQYNDSKITVWASNISTADYHPCIIWWWDLYIGSWNKVDVVNHDD